MPLSPSSFRVLGSSWEIFSPAGMAAAFSGIGVIYWLFTTALICSRFRREPLLPVVSSLPPVTFFRPIKSGVPGLREKVERLIGAANLGDEVLLGIESSEDATVCEEAAALAQAGVNVQVIRCEFLPLPNPKIAKLIQLAKHATHEHWVITDSEALLDRALIQRFRTEWLDPDLDALTAGYRFVGAKGLAEHLDHLPALLTLWPGLVITEVATEYSPRGLGLTLGACTGVLKGDLQAIGGWEAFAGYLAEDNRIGALLGALGKPVRLSSQVLTLDSDPMRWVDWFRHQHRVAVTYRVCQPAGVAGMVFTHGIAWALLALLFSGFAAWAWVLVAVVATARVITAKVSARALSFPCAAGAVLIASLAETLFWLIAWLPFPVRWGAKTYRLQSGGRMIAQ